MLCGKLHFFRILITKEFEQKAYMVDRKPLSPINLKALESSFCKPFTNPCSIPKVKPFHQTLPCLHVQQRTPAPGADSAWKAVFFHFCALGCMFNMAGVQQHTRKVINNPRTGFLFQNMVNELGHDCNGDFSPQISSQSSRWVCNDIFWLCQHH